MMTRMFFAYFAHGAETQAKFNECVNDYERVFMRRPQRLHVREGTAVPDDCTIPVELDSTVPPAHWYFVVDATDEGGDAAGEL